MGATKAKPYVCSFCEGSAIEGIHFPADFSDRENCRDGKVFIAACDECNKYKSDVEAADFVAEMFSWKVQHSMDKDDDTSAAAREVAKNEKWYRPFFDVTLQEAEATHSRAAPGTGQACGNSNDCMLQKGHPGKHMNLYARRVW